MWLPLAVTSLHGAVGAVSCCYVHVAFPSLPQGESAPASSSLPQPCTSFQFLNSVNNVLLHFTYATISHDSNIKTINFIKCITHSEMRHCFQFCVTSTYTRKSGARNTCLTTMQDEGISHLLPSSKSKPTFCLERPND